MYQIDFTTPIHIHFIGIGGISMSGLAEILLEEGFTITGSDSKESPLTRRLEEKGARVYYGQKASNIVKKSKLPQNTPVCGTSSAIIDIILYHRDIV